MGLTTSMFATQADYWKARADIAERALSDLGVTVDEAKAGVERSKANQTDAERYRWLRAQHWSESAVAVVTDPKQNVRLGAYCPSDILLDSAIDEAMKVGAYGTALKTPNGGI